MKQLENKVAIITGASSGIGYATAQLFAQEGAKIVLGARREDKLEQLALPCWLTAVYRFVEHNTEMAW